MANDLAIPLYDDLPPVLTPDEESLAINAMFEGDKAARDTLITCNLRLVLYVAATYVTAAKHQKIEVDDMVQEGVCGLINAVDNYQPESNSGLVNYAVRGIAYGVLKYMWRATRPPYTVPLTASLVDRDASCDKMTVLDTYAVDDPDLDALLDNAELDYRIARLHRALRILPSADYDVLVLRYGLDGQSPLGVAGAADALDRSVSYVATHQRQAIMRLRDILFADGGDGCDGNGGVDNEF